MQNLNLLEKRLQNIIKLLEKLQYSPEFLLIDERKSKLWCIDNFTPDLYDELKTLLLEHEPPVRIYGKMGRQHRDIGFFSDTSEGYRYSGQIIKSQTLPLFLQELLNHVNKQLDTKFNGILVNRYVDGTKYIGAHSDDESALDKEKSMVAALAYGPGIRTFRIRDKMTKKVVLDYQHTPCSLLVMEGEFQKHYTHELPVQKKITQGRISVTFRFHLK